MHTIRKWSLPVMNDFIADMRDHGVLPKDEIQRRFSCGEISKALHDRAMDGRLAQEAADLLEDGDPERYRLLDCVDDAEDRFDRLATMLMDRDVAK
jgi:hypothetical protein